ncbi:MAG: hypothetical protein IJ856_02400, partial [Candidatus Methanomethylophilaceae archaeon]|nr:hypothetical protein [Candidatus Methanomethylophilaceae archaeon]
MDEGFRITVFTDPMSLWGWAMEPAIRKIGYLSEGGVAVEYVLGLPNPNTYSMIGEGQMSHVRMAD